MTRKYESIDVLSLYSRGDVNGWNAMLTKAFRAHDMSGLLKIYYGMQAGMTDAANKHMVTPKLCEWFARTQKSLEDTMRRIYRASNPTPLDDPMLAGKHLDQKAWKKKRDLEFELLLRRHRF